MSNFVIWVSNLRILSLGLLCLWFGFAMHSFGCFVWHQRERERTRDSRNDVGLSPGGIVRHVDLEIGSFTGDISLYFACRSSRRHCFIVSGQIFKWYFSFFLLCVVLLLLLQRCGIWLWVSCAFFWIFCVTIGGVDGSGIWSLVVVMKLHLGVDFIFFV